VRLVVAGGGTGGHLFPGIAVAEALLEIDPTAEVLFVGTARGIESRAVPKAGFKLALARAGFTSPERDRLATSPQLRQLPPSADRRGRC